MNGKGSKTGRERVKTTYTDEGVIQIALVFYSVWNLTIYYLIQPFTSDLLIRSKLYEFFSVMIGVIGFILIVAGVSARWLTIAGLVITVPLIIFSNTLIYKFAPKTFKIR